MGRYTGPKNRIARRFGENIFGKKRNPLLHKANPPGMHGARRKKKSDYGLQLDEKQKLKAVYGMVSEKQLLNYFKKATQRKGNTVEHLMHYLESRLDNVVFRLKFASTIFAAHQLVSHGHILVNGKKVDRRSFQVKPGMVISVKEKSQKIPSVRNSIEDGMRTVPEYMNGEAANFSGSMMSLPEVESIPLPLEINIPLVCDFLAHTT